MKLTLEFEIDEQTQYIVVTCPELGVCTFGKNIPDAFEMIGDAMSTYWLTLEDLGELEEKVFAVAERIDVDPEEIEQDIKDAVAAVRSRGPVSLERALKMAEQAAELDDSEGLGEIKCCGG